MSETANSDVRLALRGAFRSGLVTFFAVVCGSLARTLITDLFDGKWRIDWKLLIILSASTGVIVFLCSFVYAYFTLRAAGPALAIFDRDPSLSMSPNEAMSGFVGMEYYGLILNQTYVVFIARSGLYGWKAEGAVSGDRPGFYEPYQEMLGDQELMRDLSAVEDLSKLKGGFFIPSSEIACVEASDKSKWGMGRIAHSGRIHVTLLSGKSREFIVLGAVSPEGIRDRIVSQAVRS